MWTSQLLHLFRYAWLNMVAATSTNTFGFIVWTVSLAIVLWFMTVLRGYLKQRKVGSKGAFLFALQDSAVDGLFVVTGIALLTMTLWSVFIVVTIYRDHQQLTFAHLQLAQRVADRCWVQNNTVLPPRAFPEVNSVNETLFFCNHKEKAPFFLSVIYDHPPLKVGPILFPAGRQTDVEEALDNGRIFD